ncbi:MAG: SIS domain-containing protein [Pelovirga sp.]
MKSRIAQAGKQNSDLVARFCETQQTELMRLSTKVAHLFTDGGQLLTAGGGIHHLVAQLVATQFVYRLDFDRPALPAVCLGSDATLISVMASGGEYEQLFVRHYRALAGENQLLLLMSDGGPAPALQRIRDELLVCDQDVVLISGLGDRDPLYCDDLYTCLDLGTGSRARQIELMQFAGHLLCELVEAELFQC